MEFFRVYGRVIGLLRDERGLAITLAFANVVVAALQPGDRSQGGAAVSRQHQRTLGPGHGVGNGLVHPDHPADLGPGWQLRPYHLGCSGRDREAGDVLVEVPRAGNELPAVAIMVT